MTIEERTQMIDEAEALVTEALQLVATAVEGTDEQVSADAYLLESFRTILGNGNPHNQSLFTVRAALVEAHNEVEENTEDDIDPAGGYGLQSHI